MVRSFGFLLANSLSIQWLWKFEYPMVMDSFHVECLVKTVRPDYKDKFTGLI